MDAEPPLDSTSAPIGAVRSLPATIHAIALCFTLALLLVPILVSTVAGFVAPPPWHVDDANEAVPLLVAAVMAWLVMPFMVGLWLRQWWWGPLCLAVVMLASLAWDGGHPIFRPRLGLNGAVPTEFQVVPAALMLGLLAATLGTAGVLWGRQREPGQTIVLRLAMMLALAGSVVPISVGLVFMIVNPGSLSATMADTSFLLLLGAATGGAFSVGVWQRQWWWPLVCLLGVGAMAVWAFHYTAPLDRLSWDAFGLLFLGGILAALSSICALIGVVIGRRARRREVISQQPIADS